VADLRAFIVLDATADYPEEGESFPLLIVAADEADAMRFWLRHMKIGAADVGLKVVPAVWKWPGVPELEPPLPAEAGIWNPKHWRGFGGAGWSRGLYDMDDPVCAGCGERADPDEFDRELELCFPCRDEHVNAGVLEEERPNRAQRRARERRHRR
jgi:hypothetical protein